VAADAAGLLAGVRVVDLTDGTANLCSRFLADLGADVVLVEPPDGSSLRRAEPMHEGTSLRFAMYNANKRGVAVDLGAAPGRETLRRLLDGADIVIDSGLPGRLPMAGVTPEELRSDHPGLVVVSVSNFGPDGPSAHDPASPWTLLARAAVLARSGPPGFERPLMPPTEVVDAIVAAQASWAALVAYWGALQTGHGDEVDVSAFEAVLQLFDPVFGTGGTAGAGKRWYEFVSGRPNSAHLYPIFPCRDGHVRIAVLGVRQWHGLRAWIGDPEQFMDPSFDLVMNRFRAAATLYPLVRTLFADAAAADLVAEGQRRGVPIAPVLDPREVLSADHYRERGAIAELEIAPGVRADVPTGCLEVDGGRAGFRGRAPLLGEHDDTIDWEPRERVVAPVAEPEQPLAGLRVIDLGVIVLGAEVGRLFADLGAEVIKVESRGFPDAGRTAAGGEMTPSFAWGNRNKLGLGLNLRDSDGVALFTRLAARSDLVLANFKPGTMDALGLGFDELSAVNPDIVVANSSALGSTGPWRTWMGYGPLVRAAAGLTSQWRSPEDPHSFSDNATVFPDHYAARITAVLAIAGLIDARRTGRGHLVETSQAETILFAFASRYAGESLVPGSFGPEGNDGPADATCGVFRCDGADDWCVLAAPGDDGWSKLTAAIGAPDLAGAPQFATADARVRNRASVVELIETWTSQRSSAAAVAALLDVGIAAAAMATPASIADDPQLPARGYWDILIQPGVPESMPTEARPFTARRIPIGPKRPAPLHGQHTRTICMDLLELESGEFDRLFAAGVLEDTDPWRPVRRALKTTKGS
jgi:crotonobetainyl-CoA:carnitine CoA-transferase CaiB-like acyl-CoA transferase